MLRPGPSIEPVVEGEQQEAHAGVTKSCVVQTTDEDKAFPLYSWFAKRGDPPHICTNELVDTRFDCWILHIGSANARTPLVVRSLFVRRRFGEWQPCGFTIIQSANDGRLVKRSLESKRETEKERESERVTNATLMYGNLEPTRMRWKSAVTRETNVQECDSVKSMCSPTERKRERG